MTDPSAEPPVPLRVAVAEDGALFREGLVLLLEATGHHVVGAVDDGDKLAALIERTPVDVAVLDIRMPPEPDGGLTTARRLRALHPRTGLLLLSHYAEAHYLMEILKIGTEAIGYRLKDRISSADALRDTVRRVSAGEIVIEPVVAAHLVGSPAGQPDELGSLTGREAEVLRLMAEGRSNSGIARELFLSPKAVEKNVAAIFAKLNLPTDATSHHRRVLAVLTYLRARREG
ncbi:response regulator transcription factor [Kineosporia succinea]|uniref:DNA-binding NarL/FixJ family response regulator n=1 Tax=Kineosporia succinea TaxID=84632 RepID=A0ABT9P514_9ACTN|nr:response regulator transcription factor [Kineosporia succinea]MDP9827785.1 DNA-binding NarL/FixJ family response regulator [Kineosporia succinea]